MTTTPAMEMLDLSLVDEPRSNPNSMPDREFGLLVHSIESEGFLQPVLVRQVGERYVLVDGVHRVRAARQVGIGQVPAVVLPEDYPEDKARLVQIGMNRLRGDLDLYAVARTLEELDGSEYDLELSGFSEDEIAALLQPIDDAPTGGDFRIPDVDDTPTHEPQDAEPEEEPLATLTLTLPQSDYKRAKRKLRKLGKGDIDLGFRVIMGWEPAP